MTIEAENTALAARLEAVRGQLSAAILREESAVANALLLQRETKRLTDALTELRAASETQISTMQAEIAALTERVNAVTSSGDAEETKPLPN